MKSSVRTEVREILIDRWNLDQYDADDMLEETLDDILVAVSHAAVEDLGDAIAVAQENLSVRG